MNQKNEIKILKTIPEKQQTRTLYERIFQDTKAFTDFYYLEKCKNDNRILVKEINKEIVAMVHMIPYTFQMCGQGIKSFYIFAVATDERYRRMGMMQQLLDKALEVARQEHAAFLYLLPVHPEVYKKAGYQTICNFTCLRADEYDDYTQIQASYDYYILRDEEYMRLDRLKRAALMQDVEEDTGLPENAVIMAKIVDVKKLQTVLHLSNTATGQEVLEKLRQLKGYVCEDV